ncbi:hypothetical protein [Micromonospora sp. NPDC023737]
MPAGEVLDLDGPPDVEFGDTEDELARPVSWVRTWEVAVGR